MSEENRIEKYYNEEEAFDENEENKRINELLSDILDMSKESHMELIQKIYESDKLKNLPTTELEELENLDELEHKLFDNEEFFTENSSTFSKLENLSTFIYKYLLHESFDIIVNAIKYFNYWRITLNDGNSFYRVIMFSLIEHCILEKDINFFSYILSEICSDNFIEYYKKNDIEYKKPFIILSAILLMLENDNLEDKAYNYFLKAYNLKNESFDMLLIFYLKKVLSDCSKEINKLLEEKKSEENKDIINEAKINIDQIEGLYLDPPKINLFSLVSSLFNININLILLGGQINEPFNSLKNIEHVKSPTFVFGYFFSGYHVLYPPDYDNDIFKKMCTIDNPKIYRLTRLLKEDKECEICSKVTEHMVFIKRKFLACIPCLDSYIKKIVSIRKASCFNEKCSNLEYYTRPIHLQDDYDIDDFDVMELIKNNIINRILYNSKSNLCQECETKGNEENKMMNLDCNCAYCQECLEKIILKITNNYGYLLPCEVKMFNNRFKCKCGKVYNYYDFEKLYNKNEEQIEHARKRFQRYKENNCLLCLKDLIKENDVKRIKIKNENADDDEEEEKLVHFMCIQCYKKHFKKVELDSSDEENDTREENIINKTEDKKEIKVNKDEHKIKCEICDVWHHYSGDIDGCGCNIF